MQSVRSFTANCSNKRYFFENDKGQTGYTPQQSVRNGIDEVQKGSKYGPYHKCKDYLKDVMATVLFMLRTVSFIKLMLRVVNYLADLVNSSWKVALTKGLFFAEASQNSYSNVFALCRQFCTA